jgi:hypothetical protein
VDYSLGRGAGVAALKESGAPALPERQRLGSRSRHGRAQLAASRQWQQRGEVRKQQEIDSKLARLVQKTRAENEYKKCTNEGIIFWSVVTVTVTCF